MKKRRLIPVLYAMVVAVNSAGCSGSLGFATEKGADTQASKTEAGAETRKEGDGGEKKEEAGASEDEKLIIYSPLTEPMIDSILAMSEEDTGIDAERLAVGTGDVLKRIQTKTDNPQVGILWSGAIGTVKGRSEYSVDYTASSEDALYDEYESAEGSLTYLDTIPLVIMVNTDLVGDIKVERYENLLNPELKGKIAFVDPAVFFSSFEYPVNMFYAMSGGNPDNGWDYVKQFCAQLDGKLLGGSSTAYKGVTGGEHTVDLTFEQDSAQYVGAGAPVKTIYVSEGVIFRGGSVYIIEGCLNESDAQKFVDWFTSRDVQEFMNDIQYRRTARKGVEAGGTMVPMGQIKVIQDDETDTATYKPERPDKSKELFTG